MDQSVGDCLQSLDIDDPDNFFASSSSINEEFKFLKRQYLKLCLKHHPDKGGDPERFREIQTSFECLRALFDKGKVQSFAAAASKDVSGAFDDAWAHFEGMATPSWDFYFDAEREPVPTYRVEAAKSGRAQCVATGKAKKCGDDASAAKKKEMKKGKKTKAVVLKSKGKEKDEASCIAKGELRCGWLNPESGSYGGWTHLKCWRVPSKIWLGLPDPVENKDENGFATAISSMNEVLLCGFNQLTKKQKKEFCKFVMDKSNWAKLVTKKGGVPQPSPKSTAKSHASSALSAAKSTKSTRSATKQKQSQSPTTTLATSAEIVPSKSKKKGRFVMPTPTSLTKNNLAGKTCVMTGIFPEVGGGAGLSLGKDRVKSMLQSFGAKVGKKFFNKIYYLNFNVKHSIRKISDPG